VLSAAPHAPAVRANNPRRNFWIGSLVAFAAASAVFLTFPQIDLWVSRVLYWDVIASLARRAPWLSALRAGFAGLFWISVCLSLAGLLMTWQRKSAWLGLDFRRWLFLVICMGVGPGLVANTILKDHWGRARPNQLAAFGGGKRFTPPLVLSDQCERNCSFVSGEAAAIFMPFYAAALVIPQSSVVLLAIGTLGGVAVGLIRIAQGGHFPSDIVFAGIFMAITATAVHQIMFGWSWSGIMAAMRVWRRGRGEQTSNKAPML
jgi:lipid A 4'-phosphatase